MPALGKLCVSSSDTDTRQRSESDEDSMKHHRQQREKRRKIGHEAPIDGEKEHPPVGAGGVRRSASEPQLKTANGPKQAPRMRRTASHENKLDEIAAIAQAMLKDVVLQPEPSPPRTRRRSEDDGPGEEAMEVEEAEEVEAPAAVATGGGGDGGGDGMDVEQPDEAAPASPGRRPRSHSIDLTDEEADESLSPKEKGSLARKAVVPRRAARRADSKGRMATYDAKALSNWLGSHYWTDSYLSLAFLEEGMMVIRVRINRDLLARVPEARDETSDGEDTAPAAFRQPVVVPDTYVHNVHMDYDDAPEGRCPDFVGMDPKTGDMYRIRPQCYLLAKKPSSIVVQRRKRGSAAWSRSRTLFRRPPPWASKRWRQQIPPRGRRRASKGLARQGGGGDASAAAGAPRK